MRNAPARGRAAALVAGLVALVCSVGWAAVAAYVVFSARIGPTVATISEGRGVHSGDVLALPALGLAAILLAVTVGLLQRGLTRGPALVPLRPRPVRPGRHS